MYLKSLQIHGFKSFADKTVFEFHEGVTGIVGPNGCGKSNVVDAIRWVLGETSAKALRGGEMADVIFNGTEKRRSLGMAEVTLVMGDCEESLKVDFNEVAITRRVFRDGKSEYRINGTLCRLRDIHELFMDTGIGRTAYSIMEQGKIDMLLSSRPEDRRAVFEEAAGITKFKKDKKEALRKLEYTEANLLRTHDVLEEQERRIGSLKRQVAKARRYQSLSHTVRTLESHLSHQRYIELRAEKAELQTSRRALEKRKTELTTILPETESEAAAARRAAQQIDSRLAERRAALHEHQSTVSSAESTLAFNAERRAELTARITQNEGDIAEIQQKIDAQQNDVESSRVGLDALIQRINEQEKTITLQQEKTDLARNVRTEKEAALEDSRQRLQQAQNRIATFEAHITSLHTQAKHESECHQQLAADELKLKSELITLTDRLSRQTEAKSSQDLHLLSLEQALGTAEQEKQKAKERLEEALSTARAAQENHTEKATRLKILKQLTSGGKDSEKNTQPVLDSLDQPTAPKKGIKGLLAACITVKQKYSRAIEVALGNQLQTVFASGSKLAESIIDRISSQPASETTLLPMDHLNTGATSPIKLPEAADCWAMEMVKADPPVAGLLNQLLATTLVANNLETALEISKNHRGLTIITRDGSLISPSGNFSGNSVKGSPSILLRQNEITALEDEVSKLSRELETARNHVKTREAEHANRQVLAQNACDTLQQARLDASILTSELSLLSREKDTLEKRLHDTQEDLEKRHAQSQIATQDSASVQSDLHLSKAKLKDSETAHLSLQAAVKNAITEQREADAELSTLKTALALENQACQSTRTLQASMATRLQELQQLRSRRQSEIEKFQHDISRSLADDTSLGSRIELNRETITKENREIAKLAASRSSVDETITTTEANLTDLRHKVQRITEQLNREDISLTKLDLRLENLQETTIQRHQIDLSTFEPDALALLSALESSDEQNSEPQTTHPADQPDWTAIESQLLEKRRKLDSMGPVNTDAIQEFDELEERNSFVRKQHDDLVSAKDDLLSVIEKINTETTTLFSDTFNTVRNNFREMFQELFGENGKADLVLLNQADPLESGIEVIAKPPGKKLQSISLMSGGERSMTAVALLFSIYMVKPSPFCVLDELDAPLDEANIGRFIKVLDRFIDQSQFIIVTHSKRTMARADVMYGVTMEEFGVSKPIGMRLTQAAA